MIGFPHLALGIDLALSIVLSITWLTIQARQLAARHWRKTHILAPYYQDSSTQVVRILQKLQTSYSNPASVSLADVQAVILSLQQAYGETTTLEAVIQTIIGAQLRRQLQSRRAHRPKRKRWRVRDHTTLSPTCPQHQREAFIRPGGRSEKIVASVYRRAKFQQFQFTEEKHPCSIP